MASIKESNGGNKMEKNIRHTAGSADDTEERRRRFLELVSDRNFWVSQPVHKVQVSFLVCVNIQCSV